MRGIDPFDDTTWSEAERIYFNEVDRAFDVSEDISISNGRPEHAIYLIHKFLIHARSIIRLFTGSLSRTHNGVVAYANPHITEATRRFLRRPGSRFVIVTQDEVDVDDGQSPDDHPLVLAAKDAERAGQLRGVLELGRASPEVVEFLREEEVLQHFILMDNRAYRLETDPDQATAFVHFGDAGATNILSNVFDDILWSEATRLVRVAP